MKERNYREQFYFLTQKLSVGFVIKQLAVPILVFQDMVIHYFTLTSLVVMIEVA